MQLSERQKKIVELIGDERFPVHIVERYYKENPLTMDTRNSSVSFHVRMVNCVNSYMAAIDGLLRLVDLKIGETTSFTQK